MFACAQAVSCAMRGTRDCPRGVRRYSTLGGQDAGGDVGDEAAEFVETHDLLLAENQDDEKRPFVAEAGYDVADGADFDEGVFFFAFEHGFQMRGYLRRQS